MPLCSALQLGGFCTHECIFFVLRDNHLAASPQHLLSAPRRIAGTSQNRWHLAAPHSISQHRRIAGILQHLTAPRRITGTCSTSQHLTESPAQIKTSWRLHIGVPSRHFAHIRDRTCTANFSTVCMKSWFLAPLVRTRTCITAVPMATRCCWVLISNVQKCARKNNEIIRKCESKSCGAKMSKLIDLRGTSVCVSV